jgi:HSP20 family molecular chaperone IbpA
MGDFNSDEIRNAGHEGIKVLSDTAHTFLDTIVTGFLNPKPRSSTEQPNRNSRDPGFSGDLQKIPDYYISSNIDFFIYYFFMPGVSKENSSVKISNNKLIVSGKTYFEENTITNIYYNRNLKLPLDIYSNDITANSKDGVFIVKIPKKNENIDIVVN